MFAEQLKFFRRKLNLPTARYDDITKAAHDRAFMVTGAEKADLLKDLHHVIEERMKDGKGLDAFRRDFRKIVADHGWTGWTGEGTKKGRAWRTRTIYETNLRTSYAAGRYKQLTDPDLLKVAPYWQYVHSGKDKEHAREEHKRWGDMKLTLRHDDPFWKTHYPPNGWGCGCTVISAVKPDKDAATSPPKGWDRINQATGTPYGVDKGWDYAPGANTEVPLRRMVQDKLISYPPAIQRALISEIGRQINAIERIESYIASVLQGSKRTDDLWLGFVERPERFVGIVKKNDLTGFLVLLPPDAVGHEKKSHGYDGKGQRMAGPNDFMLLVHGLETGKVTPTRNSRNNLEQFVVEWDEGGEQFKAVWEVRSGRHNRAVALTSLVIKTRKGVSG